MPSPLNAKKRILLIHTGGTIGMGIPTPPTERPLNVDQGFTKSIHQAVPELKQLAHIKVLAPFLKDSSQITPQDWSVLAQTISAHYDDYDGFVVTHGTDTMAYSATAVSYLLPYPCKPVVFTGSQRPLREIRTDARRNLICSVAIAASGRALETTVFFDTLLLRANRTVKTHIEEFRCFDSPNFPWLAEERLRTRFTALPREACSRPRLQALFDGEIQVVYPFPGQKQALSKTTRAVIILAFGCGNLPLDESSMLSMLKTCKTKKIPVILASQVTAGAVSASVYEMGRRALDLGAISAGDMTIPATLIKAMVLAANGVRYGEWSSLMSRNWAGELTITPPKEVLQSSFISSR